MIMCQWKTSNLSDQLSTTTARHFTVLCVLTVSTIQKEMMWICLAKKKNKETKRTKEKEKRFSCFSHIFHTFSWKMLAAWQVLRFSLFLLQHQKTIYIQFDLKEYIHTYTRTHIHAHTLNKSLTKQAKSCRFCCCCHSDIMK